MTHQHINRGDGSAFHQPGLEGLNGALSVRALHPRQHRSLVEELSLCLEVSARLEDPPNDSKKGALVMETRWKPATWGCTPQSTRSNVQTPNVDFREPSQG